MKKDIPQIGTKEFNDLASAYFGGKPKEETIKMTAVEWLYEQFLEGRHHTDKEYEEIFIQAEEMEKQQIENAYRIGSVNELTYGDNKAEQYYNETYKNTEQ
jgi:hypothetical protein